MRRGEPVSIRGSTLTQRWAVNILQSEVGQRADLAYGDSESNGRREC